MQQTMPASSTDRLALAFVRHGATPPNLAGLRCGGDLDPPLLDLGRRQAQATAHRIVAEQLPIGLIVTSGLKRTDETAHIIAQGLGGVPVVTDPAFAERRLGQWNLRSIAETESQLASGQTPPGGESSHEFNARIGAALARLIPQLQAGVLLVGSKGVARVLGDLTGRLGTARVSNGQLLQFDLSRLERDERLGEPT